MFTMLMHSQTLSNNNVAHKQDSIKKKAFVKQLGNGFLPTKYFNFDLRYLIKFNQYEGLRTGVGGVTNETFSENFRINGYTVYGFRDHRFKYSLGASFRLAKKTNTWLNASYTDDLQETGSTKFLTDKRFFQFFEPRLLNIELFHKHITKAFWLEHQLSPKILTETAFLVSKIEPTYDYTFKPNTSNSYTNYDLSIAKLSIQWSPFSSFEIESNGYKETKEGYPKFSIQYTKSFKDLLKSDFNFSKLDIFIFLRGIMVWARGVRPNTAL